MAYLNGGSPEASYTPSLNYRYELIIAIANEGSTDLVMNAARAAGARGGTVLHGKGTAAKPLDGDRRQDKAQKCRAGVAHENFGRVKIIRDKAQARAQQRRHNDSDIILRDHERHDKRVQ